MALDKNKKLKSAKDAKEPKEVAVPETVAEPEPSKPERDLSVVLDLPLTCSVEYGRTKISVDDFLNLKKGSVIEVDKLAGEALEFLMNGRVICKGEAVVMNERYAIRLTDIVDKKHLLAGED